MRVANHRHDPCCFFCFHLYPFPSTISVCSLNSPTHSRGSDQSHRAHPRHLGPNQPSSSSPILQINRLINCVINQQCLNVSKSSQPKISTPQSPLSKTGLITHPWPPLFRSSASPNAEMYRLRCPHPFSSLPSTPWRFLFLFSSLLENQFSLWVRGVRSGLLSGVIVVYGDEGLGKGDRRGVGSVGEANVRCRNI